MRNLMMTPLRTALLCAALLFITGMLAINWQLWHSAQNGSQSSARQALHKVDAIVDEARDATRLSAQFFSHSCTPAVQFALNREAAVQPHLRTVALLKGNNIWCSSLSGKGILVVNAANLTFGTLTLYPRDFIAPMPILVYMQPVAGGHAAASISDVHLRDVLTSTEETTLTLIVGDKMLAEKGRVVDLTDAYQGEQIASVKYPFSIGYTTPPFFSLRRLIHEGMLLTIMVAIMSLIAGSLLRRYLEKRIAPQENLKRAIERGEIVPWYQPVVDGKTGAINGVEVLARWQHPTGGLIPPDMFIPLAEKNDLIEPLTRSLMAKVASELPPALDHFPPELHVGINVSAAHCYSPKFKNDCLQFLRYFSPGQIKLLLEITEREELQLTPAVLETLHQLQEHGVELALDDFGTGYSGLSYLNELAVDFIKIDRSFVGRITDDPESTRLVDCVIEMAQKLSLRIVAEGVETRQQVDYMNQHHISLLQGYFFWKPMPLSELLAAIALKN
ncbi:EAL domain-containing protein [Enterobacteriaceae bacterium 89]|nr:EAL domain-containing protein [Enterobacteriaceae bacterium 89]